MDHARGPKEFDEDLLVELIAKGEHTYTQIAKKLGLSTNSSFVGQVARGTSRKDLHERIEAMSLGFVDQAKKLGSQAAAMAMATLVELAHDKNIRTESRRKAAMDLLAYAAGDPHKPEINVPVTQTVEDSRLFSQLPADLQREVLKSRGVEVPDEEDV